MHLSLLIFASLLLSVASTKFPRKTPKPKAPIPTGEWVRPGFSTFGIARLGHDLKFGSAEYPGSIADPLSKLTFTFCKHTYCHGEKSDKCIFLCMSIAQKLDYYLVLNHLATWNETTQPDADIQTCQKECVEDCGRKGAYCHECTNLCAIHWEFPDRREYEADFYNAIAQIRANPSFNNL
ncbi:hypothetical protein PRIPAC_73299 [Pristionchus pacificus]|uniref:Uncharacterized protein n=1 Tax=Pristionchus pacificus TaxID=54126 RepID=A0A2A6C1G5_PRIPA|nr:hypothetical protein PRIPAC_73299 [Pristionchus pacificus]|eukprot:PDM72015.1 hypothetical protein PRIPAC_38422 [Pristionchus pacificus]